MIPSKHSRSLYFTPRTPWGRYPQNRPGQNYLRASQDQKTGLKQGPVGQEAMDQLKTRADAERNVAEHMAENNVPRGLYPTGEIPGSAPMDKTGAPISVQSQISPLRAQEITNPPRKPLSERPRPSLADSAFPPQPQQTSQAATGTSGPSSQPATLLDLTKREHTQEDLKRSGGHEKAFEKPDKGSTKPPSFVPSLEITPDYRGFKLRKDF